MGFSLTGTHVIFFVAAIIVAGTVSGVFIAITLNVSNSLSDRSDRIQDQLDTDFDIINDPNNIPESGDTTSYIFYLLNIGGKTLDTSNQTFHFLADGDIISLEDYNFSDASIGPGEVTNVYILKKHFPGVGDFILKTIGPMAVEDEFGFSIS